MAEATVKAVWVAVPEMGVEVLLLVSNCMMRSKGRYSRSDSGPNSSGRSRNDAILSKCEVRTVETSTLRELLLGGGNRNALAVKLQGNTSRELATSDNV